MEGIKTLTLEVPEDLLSRMEARAAQDGMDLNSFALAALWEYSEDAEDIDPEADAALIAAAEAAIEDAAAGRLYTLEEVDARFESDFAAARARLQEKLSAGKQHYEQ